MFVQNPRQPTGQCVLSGCLDQNVFDISVVSMNSLNDEHLVLKLRCCKVSNVVLKYLGFIWKDVQNAKKKKTPKIITKNNVNHSQY